MTSSNLKIVLGGSIQLFTSAQIYLFFSSLLNLIVSDMVEDG